MENENESRFAFLEIDDDTVLVVPAPEAPKAKPPVGFQLPSASVASAAAPSEADRAQREEETAARIRAQRVNGAPLRAPMQVATTQNAAPTPTAVQARGDLIAVSLPSEVTGAVCYWSLSGSVDGAALQAAWIAEGLDEKLLPEVPSAEVALHRAVKELETKHRMVRKHPQGGWAIVDEKSAGGTLDYKVGVRIRLNDRKDGILVAQGGVEVEIVQCIGKSCDGYCPVRRAFDKIRTEIASTDVSTWLVRMIGGRLAGVPLRETGGMYFVPRKSIEELRKIKSALAAATKHTVYEIPAMHSGEAINAILDAVKREALEEAISAENDVEAGAFGKRGAGSRIKKLDEVLVKVRDYEKLLGLQMDEVVKKIRAAIDKLGTVSSRFENLEPDEDSTRPIPTAQRWTRD